MADDGRPLETAEEAAARLDGKITDLESTLLTRMLRRPVGDVEIAFRGTPKPGTIFLQGQTLQRADYPALWEWAQASGSVVAGGYGAGNSTTTFTVPDMRDRVFVGAGGAVALGGTGGSATRTLTVANLPAHDHNVSVNNHAGHYHAIDSETGSGGSHGGHVDGGNVNHASGTGANGSHGHPPSWGFSGGGHSHSINTDTGTVGLSAHVVNESSVGAGAAFDNRPPFLGVNLAVWT